MAGNLKDLNLDSDEANQRRHFLYAAPGVTIEGFQSEDRALPEGSILIGVNKGEICQAKATGGQLSVNGEPCMTIGAAAYKATGNRTLNGWILWEKAYIPRQGFKDTADLRLTAPHINIKRNNDQPD